MRRKLAPTVSVEDMDRHALMSEMSNMPDELIASIARRLDRAFEGDARPEHVVDGRVEFHREERERRQPRVDEVLADAFAIVDGRSRLLPTVVHIRALAEYWRSVVADRDAMIAHLLRDDKR